MILAALAGLGIDFVSDLIKDKGEALVTEGIKKVTGIDLTKKELTPAEIQKIKDHELAIMQLDFEKLKLEIEDRQKQEQEITKRWESDNSAGSTFAKLIRPALVAYLVIVVTILAIIDGNVGEFTIKDVWVTLFTSLTITAISGYFVLRSYEKRTGTSKWNKGK